MLLRLSLLEGNAEVIRINTAIYDLKTLLK